MAKWMSTYSKELYPCPRCQAPAGEYCREPSGRKKSKGLCVHDERMALLTPAQREECTVRSVTMPELIARVFGNEVERERT